MGMTITISRKIFNGVWAEKIGIALRKPESWLPSPKNLDLSGHNFTSSGLNLEKNLRLQSQTLDQGSFRPVLASPLYQRPIL